MGKASRRHAERAVSRRAAVIENDGRSITMPIVQALPAGMSPDELVGWIDNMGGVMERCDGCEGFVAFGFTDGSWVGANLHFGPEGCPSRHRVRRLLVQ